MADPIASLTDEQAIQAIKLFYDFSTSEVWEQEEKPGPERVRTIASALVEHAPADIQPAVAALTTDDRADLTSIRAEVCRLLLSQLQESPALRSTADRAIAAASQPNMGIDPFTGAFIIAILLATTKVKNGPKGLEVQFGGVAVDAIKALRLPELLHKLPAVLKALPESIWAKLVGLTL